MRHYNPVLHGSRNAWADQERRFKGGGGGGSSGPTTSTSYNTNIPEYAQPYVETMLGTAQQQVYDMSGGTVTGFKPYVPYSTNPSDYIAPFSPLQQQSYTAAGNLQTPSQIAAGSTMAATGGLGALGAGANYASMATNPAAMGAYMNPYLTQSLAPQLAEIGRQGRLAAQQAAGQATAQGAFGGTRGQLAQSEAQRNAMMAQQQAIGQGYNQAYQQAQQAQQFGANLGLQGYGQATQAGAALGQLGAQQQAAEQANINLQNQMGLQQQTQQQNIINQAIQNYATAQQYPIQQLSTMSSLLRGLPLQATTTESYQAAPTALSTLAGLGTGIAGAAKLLGKKGGLTSDFEVKKMAGGGVTSLANRQRLAEKLSPKQLDVVVANKTIPAEMGNELKQDSANMQDRMAQAAALTAQRQQEQQAAAQAAIEAAGIDQATSNLPAQGMAQGGIVAFAGGNLVKDIGHGSYAAPEFDYQPTMLDTGYARDILTASYNPATGKPWTRSEIASRNRAQEEAAGIKDIYGAQLEDIAAEKAKIAQDKDRAMGMALLGASGEIFKNASLPGFGGIGAGLSKFSLDYGSALDKINANEIALRKEGNAIQAAQMQMKQAQLKGDTDAYNAAETKWQNAVTNAGNLANENKKLEGAARLEATKQKFGYREKMDVQQLENEGKIAAASAGNPNKVGLALNTLVNARDQAVETNQKNWLATTPGKAYQNAVNYKSSISPDKWDPVNNPDHKMNQAKIDEGSKVMNTIKANVHQVHNPMIRDQYERNASLGSNTITQQELQGILNPGYNADNIDWSKYNR